MKNIISFIICVCAFLSCENQSEEVAKVESEDIYEFKTIEYMELESKELIEFSKLLLQYENNTNLRQTIPIDLISGMIINSFIFRDDSPNPYSVSNEDSIKVGIPCLSDDNELFLSEAKWLYSENLTEFSPEMYAGDTLYVEPYQELKVECTYIMDRYTVPYVTTFANQTTCREVESRGKWTGTFLREVKPQYNMENSTQRP
jgi:hypothetical protein